MVDRIQIVAGGATILSPFLVSWKVGLGLALVTAGLLVDWDTLRPSMCLKMFEIELKELVDELQKSRLILNATGSSLVREAENAIRVLKHALSVCRVDHRRLSTANWKGYIIGSIKLYRKINAHLAHLRRIRVDVETTVEEVSRRLL